MNRTKQPCTSQRQRGRQMALALALSASAALATLSSTGSALAFNPQSDPPGRSDRSAVAFEPNVHTIVLEE